MGQHGRGGRDAGEGVMIMVGGRDRLCMDCRHSRSDDQVDDSDAKGGPLPPGRQTMTCVGLLGGRGAKIRVRASCAQSCPDFEPHPEVPEERVK